MIKSDAALKDKDIRNHYYEFQRNKADANGSYTADDFIFCYDADYVLEKGHDLFRYVPDFERRYEKEIGKPGAYNNQKLLLREMSYPTEKDGKILLRFGTIRYFEWLILRDWVTSPEDNPSAKHSDDLQVYLKAHQSDYASAFNQSDGFSNCMWGMCGCGAWIVTTDNQLAYSKRSQVVRERPGSFGYSSAGGCDRFVCDDNFNLSTDDKGHLIDNNPFITIQNETAEELGVTVDDYAEPLKLISFGIDKTRALFQFSFLIRLNIDSNTLKQKAQEASSAWEQKTFIIPFAYDSVKTLLTDPNYEMEPGAKVSLYHCLKEYC